MAIDRTRYRLLDFIGAKILQARELNWLQDIDQGAAVGDTPGVSVSGQLQAQFRQGALYNTTIGISGLVVTLSATDGARPMMIFVRDRWEIFPGNNDDCTDTIGTFSGNHTLTLSGANTDVFLNWELKIRTGGLVGDDPALTDTITNESVAEAGELILHLSNVDTSGTPLNGTTQLAKNTSPVSLLNFTNSGSLLTLVPQDNVLTQAKASITTAGFVKSTTNTPIVVSTDDSRMTDGRPAGDGSVHDASVRTPVAPGGTNSDGTPVYNLSPDIGGISAAKLIYLAGTQLVSDFLGWIKTQVVNIQTALGLHINQPLGSVNTHPFPTAAQVSAAPLSHVGLPLNLPTSHPAVVNQDSGGFRTNRSAGGGAAMDPAYGVFVSGSPITALNHDGDVYSQKAGGSTSPSVGALTGGPLALMSEIARILAGHQNQQGTAGRTSTNPHGTSAADLGAATQTYVNTAVANVLTNAENYTNTQFSAGYAISRTGNGYIKLPTTLGNIVIQWGLAGPGLVNGSNISFPISFPHAAFTVVAQGVGGSVNIASLQINGFHINTSVSTAYWIAIGW